MKRKDVITKKLLQEILDFKGEFIDIGPSSNQKFPIEKVLGTMTTLEKTIFTLSMQKAEEYYKLLEGICGKNPKDMNPKEKIRYDKILKKEMTEGQINHSKNLINQNHFLNNLVMTLIKYRLENDELLSPITTKSGFKIVTCPIDKMFQMANQAMALENFLNHSGPMGEA